MEAQAFPHESTGASRAGARGAGKVQVCVALHWGDRRFLLGGAVMEWVVELEAKGDWGAVR